MRLIDMLSPDKKKKSFQHIYLFEVMPLQSHQLLLDLLGHFLLFHILFLGFLWYWCHVAHWLHFFPVFLWFQSAQNLAQISDLQAQLEDALKEKQEVQEKVGPGFLLLAGHWCDSQLKGFKRY